jgi:hypothetical protein
VTPPTVRLRFAFLGACEVLVGRKTTLMMQLSPEPRVVPEQVLAGLGWML